MFIIEALWFIIPAFAANAFPVLVKGTKPLDRGRYFRGQRLLGDGKTIRGAIAGIIFGIIFGSIQVMYQHLIPVEWGLNLIEMTFPLVILLSVGAIAGDILGSFVKRRYTIERGASAPLLDQLDFLIIALLFSFAVYVPDLLTIITLIILTPIIHLLANVFGYFIKLKKNPW